MKRLIVAACIALASCAPASEPAPAAPAEASEPAPDDGPAATAWEDADGPGETALVIRLAGDTQPFTLTCRKADRVLVATADADQLGRPGGAAQLIVAGAAFDGASAVRAGPDPIVRLTTPVTPALLAALAGSANTTARIVIGDSFAESALDTEGRLAAFGARCATLVGAAP